MTLVSVFLSLFCNRIYCFMWHHTSFVAYAQTSWMICGILSLQEKLSCYYMCINSAKCCISHTTVLLELFCAAVIHSFLFKILNMPWVDLHFVCVQFSNCFRRMANYCINAWFFPCSFACPTAPYPWFFNIFSYGNRNVSLLRYDHSLWATLVTFSFNLFTSFTQPVQGYLVH